jgi:hypothetical protein
VSAQVAVARRWDDAAVDAATAALFGAGIGVAPATVKAVLDWRSSRAGREHETKMKLREERLVLVKQWRQGLAVSHAAYRQWLIKEDEGVPPRTVVVRAKEPLDVPDAAPTEWFASLRRHISEQGAAARFREAEEVMCDKETVVILQIEIGRIERKWLDDETQ